MNTPTDMICICCPFGCELHITKEGEQLIVTGNKCPRGKKYAIEEMTAPKRVVTSTVAIVNGIYPVISVKTAEPIAKEKIFTIMEQLSDVVVAAPIKMGDVVVENIANTGVNIIATRDMAKVK